MSIEGVTGAQIIQKLKSIDQASPGSESGASASGPADDVNISNDAKLAQTLNRAFEEIEKAPDVREDRVADVKEKLEQGFYEQPEVVDEVADRITDLFLGQ